MKAYKSVIALIQCAVFLSVLSCNKEITDEFIGNWEAGLTKITVRTQDDNRDYHFISDSAFAIIQIYSDNTASGFIGSAEFTDVPVKKNFGNPEYTGIAYNVKCGELGKIFPDDPLNSKEVQIWLCPLKNEMMEGELRYTEGMAQFPMAGLMFYKTE